MNKKTSSMIKGFISRMIVAAVILQNFAFAVPVTQAAQTEGSVVRPMISGGNAHTLALKSDGTVWAWGNNNFGQLGDGSNTLSNVPVQVSGLTGVMTIDAGFTHSLALKSDGTVWAWGRNVYGELGDGTNTDSNFPVQVSGLSGVTAIVAGQLYSLALKSDGTVWAWGNNTNGQLGDGTNADSTAPVQVTGLTGATAIASGVYTSVALKSDGTVRTWGYNNLGQLGNGNTGTNSNVPVTVTGLSGVKDVSAGNYFTVALLVDGTVQAWGDNNFGTLGDGTNTGSNVPVTVTGLSGVKALVTGSGIHTLALMSDGTVQAWGYGINGQLGTGAYASSNTPVTVSGLTDVTSVAAGTFWSLALKTDGTLRAWGNNGSGQLGIGSFTSFNAPVTVTGFSLYAGLDGVVAITGSSSAHSLALKVDGTVWGWGNDNSGELGNAGTSGGSTNFAMQVHGVGNVGFLTGVTSIAVCRNHSLATLADGTALAWGENIYGQLGDGTTTGRNVPVVVSGLTDVIAVTCGDKASLALKADGTIWSWGDNSVGQLGDGNSPTDSLTPVSVSGLSGVKGISGGGNGEHFLAVLSDGTVRDWGWGIYCQLGNGACSTSDVPVTVSGLSDVTSVSGGDAHSLARKSDGTVWGWGYGNQGQLGNGSFSGSNVPVQASGITTAVAVAGGHLHSVALLSDGTVRTWGYNVEGQLGDGTTSDSNTPVTAAGVSGVTAIAAGYLRTIVLNTNGTIQDWGRGVSGDLGNCTYNSNLSPVQVIFGSCPTIPNAVADLAATPGNTSASLTWTAPFDGGSAITAYAVHYSIDAFAFDDQTCADASCTDTTAGASVPGLTNGVLYTFRVYAVNAIGSSAASNTSTATPTSGLSNNTTANQVLMSRLQVGVQSTTSISFTLADTLSSQLTVTFDPAFSGIDVSGAAATTPSAPGCMTNFLPVGGNVFTADKSGCIGDILITGILITNPGTPGSYSVSWTNDDPGYAMVAIVDSDQVTVSATIDPTITFDLNADNDNSADAAPYSVDLGALTIGAVNHTDNGGIPGIWANLDTNATGGAIVTVLSANAALKSISTPGDAIPNSAGTMSGGTANYGLCVENVIGPTWASGIFQATAPYNAGTCDPASASNDVKTLSAVTPTPILDSSSAPVTTGAAEILVNAAISTSTAAHSDYTDTLTFVATGTF